MLTRRSLGRLIVGGGFFINHLTNICCASTSSISTSRKIYSSSSSSSSYAFPTSFTSYPFSHFSQYAPSGYSESKHYCTEAQVQGRSYIDNGDRVEEQRIKKGDIISLNDLLFISNRDYLVRNNNEHVKAEQLEGKVVGLYILPLDVQHPHSSTWYTTVLKDVYNDLRDQKKFEVVLVHVHDDATSVSDRRPACPPVVDPQKHLEDLFSLMPWPSIPFSDAVSRERIKRHLLGHGGYSFPTLFVVDSTGVVLQCDVWTLLHNFGAPGYPFSDERIDFLKAEDAAAAKQPFLKTLLASPRRNYVISGNGDKVSIDTLEDKVVALYFYHADTDTEDLTRALKFAYEELAKMEKNFEVVLVYLQASYFLGWRSDCEEAFWEEFKTMPWLALPIRDENCKKLKRIFEISSEGQPDPNKLVILGPRAEFIEPFGASILFRYNILAYPFTLKKAVELEIEKIKELKLEMLLDPNTVLRRNYGERVPFSELYGKRVMLIFERIDSEHDFSDYSPNTKFSLMLKGRYLHTRGTDDEFEVIRILIDNDKYCTRKDLDLDDLCCLVPLERDLGHKRWLVSLASNLKYDLGSPGFWYGTSIRDFEFYLPVVAFDRDGRLVRKTIYPTFENLEFPFYAGSLEEEMSSQLATLLNY